QRTELRARWAVVDDLRVCRPRGRDARGREVGPGAAADRDRFPDVQGAACGVPEQIDTGISRKLSEVEVRRSGVADPRRLARGRAVGSPRLQLRERVADGERVRAQTREQ